jgi:hypothetical protein
MQAMGLQKSNGDLQKSRRLGFTFTFHFNVITLIRRFWLDEISHSLYVHWSNRNRIHVKFTVESNLILPTNYPIDFTFHHHNGKGKSQIDYILFNGKTLNLQPSVSIMPFEKSNGDLQKSRRLGFTFTFHFNVIKQLQSFVSINTRFYGS